MPYQEKRKETIFTVIKNLFSLRRWLNDSIANGSIQIAFTPISGEGDPTDEIVPTAIGQIYVDTEGPDVYIATGLTDADWVAVFTTT
jgi:hypothetical protein